MHGFSVIPRQWQFSMYIFTIFAYLSAAKKLELDVSGYLDISVGDHECIVSIATLHNLDNLSELHVQSLFLHRVLAKESMLTDCISPSDVQEGTEYVEFREKVKEAALSGYSEGMIQLECIGGNDNTLVSYAWKSSYGGLLSQSAALPIRKTQGSSAMLKLKGFFSKK